MSKNYYEILGVDKNATPDEIKKAYRKKANETHPDKTGGSDEKFKDVSEAYENLSDPQKKQMHDMGGSRRHQSHGFDMNDIFSQFGDIFGGGRPRTKKGGDLRVQMHVTLEEVITGVTKKIKYSRQIPCIPCNGKGGTDSKTCNGCNGSGQRVVLQQTPFGHVQQATVCNGCNGSGKTIINKCNTCSGNGTVNKEESLDVVIPAGVDSGMQLNMKGQGNCIRDGIPGDLFILIEQIKHNRFIRDGIDLYTDEWISISDAVLGTKLNIHTMMGDINLNITPGCESGKVFTSNGKGVPNLGSNGRIHGSGNLYIKVNVKIPKNITDEEKEIFKNLKC